MRSSDYYYPDSIYVQQEPKEFLATALWGLDGRYLAFSPHIAFQCIPGFGLFLSPRSRVKTYYFFNKRIINRHVKEELSCLHDYMVGIRIPIPIFFGKKPVEQLLSGFDYVLCQDVMLTVYVLSMTVGDLFVPNRKPSFDLAQFESILLFQRSEVFR